MFARKVTARLKPNSLTEFTSVMEEEIIPWLRQQNGFVDLIIMVAQDGSEVTTISFWDFKGNAQAYNSSGYPEVLKILEQLLDGTPYVKTFEVVRPPFEGHSPRAQPKPENLVQETGLTHSRLRAYETSA
jgi:hypothetical protein